MDALLGTYFLKSQKLGKSQHLKLLDQIWKRQAPKNGEDPSKKILKILDMGSVSTSKHHPSILFEV